MIRRWTITARHATARAGGLTSILIALALTLSACTSAGGDTASAHSPSSGDGEAPPGVVATPYYVEFRTRPYSSITHTFVVYGAQDPAGHPLGTKKAVGFVPNGGDLGPFIGIVAIGGVVNDEAYYVDMPSSTVYHRNLTAEQYGRLTHFIEAESAGTQVYNLIFNNCNDFVARAADSVGLKVPFFHAMPPPMFISLLGDMNK